MLGGSSFNMKERGTQIKYIWSVCVCVCTYIFWEVWVTIYMDLVYSKFYPVYKILTVKRNLKKEKKEKKKKREICKKKLKKKMYQQ